MYRLDRMRRDYERFTKAESYIIGFELDGIVYGGIVKEIPRRYLTIQREKLRNGSHDYGLYVNARSKKVKNELLKNSIVLGTSEDLIDEKYNKGVMLEKLVYEYYGQEFKGKDAIPFYESGDINVNGVEIQVKFGLARVVSNGTLTRLKNRA